MDRNKVTTNINIDFSKAFDTLNHSILLKKIEYYGIADNSLSLLDNYLTDRCQYVEYNGHKSNTLPISTGVPQGSVLRPLLSIIYINDLPMVNGISSIMMYASVYNYIL